MLKKFIKSNKYLYEIAIRGYQWINKHNIITIIRRKEEFLNHIEKLRTDEKKKYIYCLIEPEHGNIGDIALAYAQKKFLSYHFPDYPIIDISAREYNHYKKIVKKIIKNGDIIVLIGGGSLGDQYIEHENDRRNVIRSFPNNLIISFPQSMYFSKTKKGNKELQRSIKCYSKNNNLVLVARDKVSYSLMKENFINNRVILTPDIVLYLDETYPKRKRKGASLFLRSDVEGLFNSETKNRIESITKKYFEKVEFKDTKINKIVSRSIAEKEFKKMLESFKESTLVITDRLHGMIFATITSTPCIVFSNYNHKIKSQYEWIKHLDYIIYCDNVDNIEQCILNLNHNEFIDYDNSFAKEKYYSKIIEAIKN